MSRKHLLARAHVQTRGEALSGAASQETSRGVRKYPAQMWQRLPAHESEGVQALLWMSRFVCIVFPFIAIPWVEYQGSKIEGLQRRIATGEEEKRKLAQQNHEYAAEIKYLTKHLARGAPREEEESSSELCTGEVVEF